jgi:DNA (cytosine-5)-methyltransferase 1
MTAYYNEIDPYAAQWLRNLIDKGLIARGDVDERSIVDVRADDLRPYTQAHFFAGIGGWSVALRLAGWGDDRPVWTGSCPCQPFAKGGKRQGSTDARHLWPAWFDLVAKCAPAIVFGEQVASKDGFTWLAGIRADLEATGYVVGAADLCAAGVAAPHIRQRIYWVGNATSGAHQGTAQSSNSAGLIQKTRTDHISPGRSGGVDFWRDAEPVKCDDGVRRAEPGTFPLVDGVPKRLEQLRAYGSAIVPQVAAEFVKSFTEWRA